MSHTYGLADLREFLASMHRIEVAAGYRGLVWRALRIELASLGGYHHETRGRQ